jgi:hypothetical protein
VDDAFGEALQLLNVFSNQQAQQLIAGRRQLDDRAAKVAFVGVTAYQTGAFRAIDKLYCAVVAKHHAIRKVAHRGWLPRGRCGDDLQ